ncbi:MAG: ATP-binding protein [Methanimicrococcus sp.]|nr:ATP-binding protein [Methanimicrococcus sp.]
MEIDFREGLSKGQIVYDRLAMLQNQIIDTPDSSINIEFHNSGRVGRTFTFIIGCLPMLGKQHQKTVSLVLPPRIMTHMKNMDIYDYYSNPTAKLQRFQRIESKEELIPLVLGIIKDAPVTMSEGLQELLVSRIGEVYNNAFEHSNATYIIAGKYFKANRTYCFSVYDTGIGIAGNVQEFLGEPMTDSDALKWALKSLNTTKPGSVPRGLGLSLLLEFAKVNKGEVRICTGNVLFTFSKEKGSRYNTLENKFIGTLFEMDIIPDDLCIYEI